MQSSRYNHPHHSQWACCDDSVAVLPRGNLSYATNKPSATHPLPRLGPLSSRILHWHCGDRESDGEKEDNRRNPQCSSTVLPSHHTTHPHTTSTARSVSSSCRLNRIESVSGKIRVPKRPFPFPQWLGSRFLVVLLRCCAVLCHCGGGFASTPTKKHADNNNNGQIKRMIFKASITFNCRGLKEQMSFWKSGRFVCAFAGIAMPFLIIKILIFKKIRNKQPLRKCQWNDNNYEKN